MWSDLDGAAKPHAMVEQNLRTPAQHLRTHPAVAACLAEGRLSLHRRVHDVEGRIVCLRNGVSDEPVPLDQAIACKRQAR
jgi:carbonic anhydrase